MSMQNILAHNKLSNAMLLQMKFMTKYHCNTYKSSEHVHLPATSTPLKRTNRKKPTINTSPVMVPTAIPAMAPGDSAVVSGDKLVAVGGET